MENHRGPSSRGAPSGLSGPLSGAHFGGNRSRFESHRLPSGSVNPSSSSSSSSVSFAAHSTMNSTSRLGSPLKSKTLDSKTLSFVRNPSLQQQPVAGSVGPARTSAPSSPGSVQSQSRMVPGSTGSSRAFNATTGTPAAPPPGASTTHSSQQSQYQHQHQHMAMQQRHRSQQHQQHQHHQQPVASSQEEEEEMTPFNGGISSTFVARNSREGMRRSHAGLISIQEGDLVWVHDPLLVCVPAVVVRVGFLYDEARDQEQAVVIVHTEDGEEREIRDHSLLQLPLCHHPKQLVPASLHDLTNILLGTPNSDGQMEFFSSKQLESTVLHILRARYRVDLIYTWLDKLLISVNPCQALPIYTPAQMRDIAKPNTRNPLPDELLEPPVPHVFALAQNAFQAMHESKEDQAIVVLGAMGAGKSEASKLIVQYLCEIGEHPVQQQQQRPASTCSASSSSLSSSSASASSSSCDLESDPTHVVHPIAQQILHAFTILESFGNAATKWNRNASRVGKMISVEFSRQGAVIGGGFTTHYFERSRVVEPKAGERNFHVFYQVLAGIQHDPTLRDSLELNHSVADFELLKTADTSLTKTALDARDYRDLMSSLSALHIRKNQRLEIIRIVAALLHLGNVEFIVDKDKASATDSSSPCSLKDPSQIVLAARLLEVEPVVLDNYFRTRQFFTKEGNKTVSSLKVVSVVQARRARDTFVRSVYEALFGFLVDLLNGILGSIFERYEKSNIMVNSQGIHVLDIVGFEQVGADGFDQLCFNYWSEKLHHFFLQSTLRVNAWSEDTLASSCSNSRASLALASRMALSQSEECLSLFDNVPFGIFALLNEHGKVRNSHDEDLVAKIWAGNEGVKCLKRPLMTHNELLLSTNPPKEWKVLFVVQHFCADVTYSGKGLAAKNTLTISSTCAAIMQSSKNSVLHAVGTTHMAAASKADNKFQGPISMSKDTASITKSNGPDSASVEMMRQADALLQALTQTGKHFMVCVKPNDRMEHHLFDANYVVSQLRDYHVVNLVQSSRSSFSVSVGFVHFFQKYRGICGHRGSVESLVRSLLAIGMLDEDEYQLDNEHGRVLLTAHQAKVLDKAREEFWSASAVIIQRNVRLRVLRKTSNRLLMALRQLRACMDKKQNDAISRSLAETKALLSQGSSKSGSHLRIIRKAQDMLLQMDDENYVSSLVEDAATTGHPVIAQFAIQVATNAGSSISTKHLQRLVRGRCGSAQATITATVQLEEANAMLRQFIIDNKPQQLIGALASVDGPADSLERKLGTMMVIRSLEEKSATDAFIRVTGAAASSNDQAARTERDDAAWKTAVVKMVTFGLESKHPEFLQVSAAPTSPSELREPSVVRIAPSVFTGLLSALKKAMEDENLIACDRIVDRIKGLNMRDARMQDPLIKKAEDAVAAGRSKLSSHSERQQTIKFLSIAPLSVDVALMNDAIKAAQDVGLAQWDFNLKNATKERDRLLQELQQGSDAGAVVSGDDLAGSGSPSEDSSAEESDPLISTIWHSTSLDELVALKRRTTRAASNMSPSLAFAKDLLDIKIRRQETIRQLESGLLNATKSTKPKQIEEAFEKAIKMGYWSHTFAPLFEKYYELAHSDEPEGDLRAVVSFLSHRLDANAELRHEALSLLNALVEKQHQRGPNDGTFDEELLTKAGKLKRRLESLVSNRDKLESMLQLPEEKLHVNMLMSSLEAAKAAGVQGKLIERAEVKVQALAAASAAAVAAASMKEHQKDATDASSVASDPSLPPPPPRWNRCMSTDVGQENLPNGDRAPPEERNATSFHRFENLRSMADDPIESSNGLPPRPPRRGTFLQWEARVLSKSLCVMPDDESDHLAIVVNKCILGYMRDRIVFYREMLAQYILQIGLAHQSYIVDEIYVQLMKQLLRNPKRDSSIRGWCLFAMCVSSFAPSMQLEKHVLMFLKSQVIETNSFWRLVKSLALFCLRKLENLLTNGASGFIPSMEEIRAYEVRPPFLATIELMDGTPLADGFPVTPELTVAHLVEICVHFLGLCDQLARFFGITALSETNKNMTSDITIGNDDATADANANTSTTTTTTNTLTTTATATAATATAAVATTTTAATTTTTTTTTTTGSSSFFHKFLNGTNFLSQNAFLGDIFEKELVRGRENQLRFVLKIRLSSSFLLDMGKQDAMLNRLIYVQLSDDMVKGHLPVLEQESVVRLTCLAMAVDGGEDFRPTELNEIVEMNVMEYIPNEWQQAHPNETEWATLVLEQFRSLQTESRQITCNDFQEVYIEEASRHRLFGSVFFPSKLLNRKRDWMALIGIDLPSYFVVAVNRFGVFVVGKDGALIGDFDFMEVLGCVALGGPNSHQVKFSIRKQADSGMVSSSLNTGAGPLGMSNLGMSMISGASSEEILLSTKYSDELCDLIADYKQLETGGGSTSSGS